MKTFLSILLVIAVLLVFFNHGNISLVDPEVFFDKIDIAYYKLEIKLPGTLTDSDDDTDHGILKTISKALLTLVATPQYAIDIISSTIFLFTANPVNFKVYDCGNREFLYTSSYGWLVRPSREKMTDNFYSARFPDTVFHYNSTMKRITVDGQIPVIGGGVR